MKKTGSITQRVGSVPKPTAKISQVGGGTCHKGMASNSGASGKQTSASSNRTKC